VHESFVTIIMTALNEGEVFSGADKEYAFRFEAKNNHFHIGERDDRGGTTELNMNEEEMLQWLRHFPLFSLISQLEHYLIARGMKHLENKDPAQAFIFFSLATEHGMQLGNIGLALLYFRNGEKKKASDALSIVPLSPGTPYCEIPIKSFLIHTDRWETRDLRNMMLKEFLQISPDHKDAMGLSEPLNSQ